MAEKGEQDNRITFTFEPEIKELINDTSMILGLKQSEFVSRAITKYVEAIKKQVGPEFDKALEGIKAVRAISG